MIELGRWSIADGEVELTAVRSQGAGGQNVNKVSSAIHLRFDIAASSLPAEIKERLLQLKDRRVTEGGIVVIKAQQHRSQDMNRDEAIERLRELVERAAARPAKRIATKPPRGSKRRRLESKLHRAQVKALRGRVTDER